jgi:hypothetical protein
VTFDQWLENLSENDRQRLIDHLIVRSRTEVPQIADAIPARAERSKSLIKAAWAGDCLGVEPHDDEIAHFPAHVLDLSFECCHVGHGDEHSGGNPFSNSGVRS